MYTTTMTPIGVSLLVFLFFCFFIDITAKPTAAVMKIDMVRRKTDKETSFPLLIHDTNRKLAVGVPTISTPTSREIISDYFKRPLSITTRNNALGLTSKLNRNRPRRRRQRRYVLQGSTFQKYDITWSIDVYSQKLTNSKQVDIFKQAFNVWAQKCTLSFIYVSGSSNADILIKFVTGYHGDGQSFDDAGDIKAHSFFPMYGSDIHFDEYENWIADPSGSGGDSLLTFAIHEIGHSLGLDHSSVPSSVMHSIVAKGRNSLDNDDILGIQALYGKCILKNVDSVLTSSYHHPDTAFVFKNEWVWQVSFAAGQMVSGSPVKVTAMYSPNLNNKYPFRSVFYDELYGQYIFFYDNGFLLMDENTHYTWTSSYNSWSLYPFLTSAPDAAMADLDYRYFFVGANLYKIDTEDTLLSGYPKSIQTAFPGVPSHVDAAYYNFQTDAYVFIKANSYYIKDTASGSYYGAGVINDLFKNLCPT